MTDIHFNPFGTDRVIVDFPCDECKNNIESESIFVPEPNFLSDTARESYTENEGYAVCPSCAKQFTIRVNSGYAGGYIEIIDYYENEKNISVKEISKKYLNEEFEAILSNTKFYSTYQNSIQNLRDLNDIQTGDDELDGVLYKQIWVSVITVMETYLSDALINTVLNYEFFKKKFVMNFEKFSKRKFELNKLYKIEENIEDIIKSELSEIMYHNLPKLNGIYRDTLGVEFGDFERIQLAVLKRHDIVHRNGADKEGNTINIRFDEVEELIAEMDEFISRIDEHLNYLISHAV